MAKVVHYILSSDSETEDVSPRKASSPVLLCPSPISYAIGLDPSCQKLPWRKRSSGVIDLDCVDKVYLDDPMVIDKKPQRVDRFVNNDFSCVEISGKDFRNLPSKRTRGSRIFPPSSNERTFMNDIASSDAPSGFSNSIPVLVDKSMDENVDFNCVEVSGKDFSKIPSKRTRRRLFAPVSVPAKVPELVNEDNDENIDSNCIEAPVSVPAKVPVPDVVNEDNDENSYSNCEMSSKDFSKIPSKRTRSRVFAPVSVPSTLDNTAKVSTQNGFGYAIPEICGSRYNSVGKNVGDGSVIVKNVLSLRVDGDAVMYQHKRDGLQHPTLVTGKPSDNSSDSSLKCSATHGGSDIPMETNVSSEKVYTESQLGKRDMDGDIVYDESGNKIISSSVTKKDVASTLAASLNDFAHHLGIEEKKPKPDGAIINDKDVKPIISPSLMNKGVASTPAASLDDSVHHLGIEEKKPKTDGAIINDKDVKPIISPSLMNKGVASTPAASLDDSVHHLGIEEKKPKTDGADIKPKTDGADINKDFSNMSTASVSDSANHPGIEEMQTHNDERGVYQAAVEDLSQPKEEANLPDGLLSVPLLKHQKIALAWMVRRETTRLPCLGGILADDQGLGKTVSMIALILHQRFLQSQSTSGANCADHVYKERPEAGTLIVCPTSIICQWEQELKDKVADGAKLSVLVYHGPKRTTDPVKLAKYDVVLTTYAVVANAFPKQGGEYDYGDNGDEIRDPLAQDPLAKVDWLRVILDEAQCIKNHRTRSANACCCLQAKSRWCLSGTPLQNKVDDLYSYFRFLKYHPYSVYQKFNASLKIASRSSGYKKLQVVLKTILLRRTKDTLIDGEPIITLPPKSISLMKVELSTEERSFYSAVETRSIEQFRKYERAGIVSQNYANILALLSYLRMACDHPILLEKPPHKPVDKTSLEMARKLPRDMLCKLFNLVEDSSAVCGKCKGTPEDAVVTMCCHVFCHQCVAEHLVGAGNLCPEFGCKIRLSSNLVYSKATLATLSRFFSSEPSGDASEFIKKSAVLDRSYRSSKIKAALEILKSNCKLNNQSAMVSSEGLNGFSSLSPGDCSVEKRSDSLIEAPVKTIVFSQWTRMLDLMGISLDQSGIKFKRFDGSMSIAERDKTVKDFIADPEVHVILMSLKAGNLGLNLVAACHVILLDLWWNPTTEDQAIDRAHRLGQTRPVTVTRLAVSDSVEDRILNLQETKRKLVASVFGGDKFGGSARLSVDDLRYLFGS